MGSLWGSLWGSVRGSFDFGPAPVSVKVDRALAKIGLDPLPPRLDPAAVCTSTRNGKPLLFLECASLLRLRPVNQSKLI